MMPFRGPGDGWVQCRCGLTHWGLHGASGIFLVHREAVLLQKRANWSHMGGTWALPGGARMPEETAEQAALREAAEEVGLAGELVAVHGEHTVDHGDWSYTTVIGFIESIPDLTLNAESERVAWVSLDEIHGWELHPGFRSALPDLLELLSRRAGG